MKNMTIGNPLKLIFFFALPLMLGNILQQVYIMADTMIVGQFVGVNALASLGAADWINWAILGIVMGFTQGFSIRISNTLGAKDYKAMEKAMAMIIILCIGIALSVTLGSLLIIRPLLVLLNTPSNIIQGSITYLTIISLGIIVVTFYNCFSSILRALGNSKTPLAAMIIASLLNIGLDLLFVCQFQLNIAGAAIATVVAQAFAALLCLYILSKELPFKLTKESFQLDTNMIKDLFKLGTPLACQNLIISIGGIVVQSVINSYGFLFVAGFTATNKLYGLLEVAAISFGYAITTFNSQNLGAKHYKRMKQGVFQASALSLLTSLMIGGLMIVFGKNILMLFISADEQQTIQVLTIAYKYLRIMAICLPILYVLHTYRSALQGMEETFIPMLSGIVELIMRITSIFILPLYLGQDGIYFAEVIAWSGAALLLYLSYKMKIRKLY